MKGQLLHAGEHPHSCPTPGPVARLVHRVKPGALWRCTCGQVWRRGYDYAGMGWFKAEDSKSSDGAS